MKKNKSWPLGLTIVFIVFFLYLIGFIILSLMNRTDLVAEDYYEREVAYQDQIDRIERSKELNQSVKLDYNPTSQIITLEFPSNINPDSIIGSILFFRPSDAKQDRIQTIQLNGKGIQTLNVKNLSKGMWRIKILWQIGEEEYYNEKILSLK